MEVGARVTLRMSCGGHTLYEITDADREFGPEKSVGEIRAIRQNPGEAATVFRIGELVVYPPDFHYHVAEKGR